MRSAAAGPGVFAAPPRPRRVERTRVQGEVHSLFDVMAFAASVGLILIYGQIWYAPLTGYGQAAPPWIGLGFYPAYILAIGLVAMRPARSLQALLRSPFLIGLILLAAASVTWSIAPGETPKRVIALVFTTLAGVGLASRWRWTTLIEVLATAFSIMIVLCYLLGVLKPEWGRMQELFPGAWRGLWLEKNALGDTMSGAAATLTAAALMVPKRRWLWLGFAALAVGLVLLSTSKTALVVLMVSFAAIAFVAIVRSGPIQAVAATWLAVAAVAVILTVVVVATDAIFDLLGKDATLTGRTKIWDAILILAQQRPWTGYGYGAVWDNTAPGAPLAWIERLANFKPAHAHNSWLELQLGLGLPAVILFGLWVIEVWGRGLWLAYARPAGWVLLPSVAAYTLVSLTESITLNWHDMRWVLFVALALKAALGDAPEPSPQPARFRRAAP